MAGEIPRTYPAQTNGFLVPSFGGSNPLAPAKARDRVLARMAVIAGHPIERFTHMIFGGPLAATADLRGPVDPAELVVLEWPVLGTSTNPLARERRQDLMA